MKHIKRLFIGLVVLFALLIGSLYIFDYDYLIKGVRTIYLNGHKTAYLSDYQQFDNRIIEKETMLNLGQYTAITTKILPRNH